MSELVVKKWWNSPGASPQGLDMYYTDPGHKFWGVDVTGDGMAYLMNASSPVEEDMVVLDSWDAPDIDPRGVTYDGTNVWISGDDENKIYKCDQNTGAVLDSWASPSFTPRGLAWDGTYLWHADQFAARIYQIDTDGNVQTSFASPDSAPRGLCWVGPPFQAEPFLWLIDGNTPAPDFKVILYKLEMDGTVVDSWVCPTGFGFGIAQSFPPEMYYSDYIEKKIYMFELEEDVLDVLDGIDMYTDEANIMWDAYTDGTDVLARYRTAPHTTWSSAIEVDTGGTYTGAGITGNAGELIIHANNGTTVYQFRSLDGGANWIDDGEIS